MNKLTPEELARCHELGIGVPENRGGPQISIGLSAAPDEVAATPSLARVARAFGAIQQHDNRDMLTIDFPDGEDGITIGNHPGDRFVHD